MPGFHSQQPSRQCKTQKQSDYLVEQSSFELIALFSLSLVIVVVEIGLMETRLYTQTFSNGEGCHYTFIT